jgi:hypothetical protein
MNLGLPVAGEGEVGELGDCEATIAGRGDELRDPALNCSRASAHALSGVTHVVQRSLVPRHPRRCGGYQSVSSKPAASRCARIPSLVAFG